MNAPCWLGDRLPDAEWQTVRLETVFECCKWDVQSEDHCVLADFPLFLEESEWTKLRELAQALSRELDAAEREVLDRPDLHLQLGLSRSLLKALRKTTEPTPGLARVMRFDFHFTSQGWRISEVNADVPGGFIEASGFTRLMAAYYAGAIAPPDPAEIYAQTIANHFGTGAIIGLVYATAYSDDGQVMHFLAKHLRRHGLYTIMISPAHINWEEGHATIHSSFAKGRLDAIVRFFPAEWLPSLPRGIPWAQFFHGGRTPMSNPATAILVQSKRFPLLWNHLSTNLSTWGVMLPTSVCPSTVLNDLRDWVLKPSLGRMGEDVAIPGVTAEPKLALVRRAVKHRPRDWVAQRRFMVPPLCGPAGNYYPTIGIFTIDGYVAGAYARIGRKPLIDDEAQDVALLIARNGRHL